MDDSLKAFGDEVLEGRLDPRVALECFLLVRLGVRTLAIVTLPAELPDGDLLGAQVDFEFRGRLVGQARDLKTRFNDAIERRRLKPVAFKTFLLRSSFANIVLASHSYLTHKQAGKSIGLDLQETEVRPAIREWFVSRPEDRAKILDLLSRRRELQRRGRAQHKPSQPVTLYVYPEETDADYLRSLGQLLGYPECCVEAYVGGRVRTEAAGGIPEDRAAAQIRDGRPALSAFWVKDFFPCRPDCPEAEARGRQARALLAQVRPEFAEIYAGFCRQNLERVSRGPEDIRRHGEWLDRGWSRS